MRFNLLYLVMALALGCGKKQSYPVEIIGHAGNGLNNSSSIYHPNSLESIELALGMPGVSGVEVDLQLSADKEFWLLHDDRLESETTGTGCVSESTYETLKNVRFKTINKEHLVRLKDVNFSAYSGKTVYLDIRHYNGCTGAVIIPDEVIGALQETIETWMEVNFIVVTNFEYWLNQLSETGWTVYADVYTMDHYEALKQGDYPYDGIIIRNSKVTKEDVTLIKSENKKVILFDMRAPKPIRQAMQKQPDAVIVDDLKAALIEKSN